MRTRIRFALVGGMAYVAFLAVPHAADACVCTGYPNLTAEQVRGGIEKDLERATAVFTGEALAADLLVGVLRVDKVWKGKIGTEVRMRHATKVSDREIRTSSCEYTFTPGERYVVFGRRVSSDLMTAGRCGFTAPLKYADQTIQVLDVILAIRQGQLEPDAYARFLSLEQSFMKAVEGRDMPAVEALLAPEFTIFGGSVPAAPVTDRALWLRNVGQFPWPKHDITLVKVHDRGDVVIVHAVLRATYPAQSITPEGGDVVTLVTDTWIKRGAAWQVLSRQWSLIDR